MSPVHSDSSTPILVFGDSLSAAHGIPAEQGWVTLMQSDLRDHGLLRDSQEVANASVSGETTSGGLARLPQALKLYRPVVVIIELGANDALRQQSMEEMRGNLSKMVEMSQASGAKVLLVGVGLTGLHGLALSGSSGLEDQIAMVAREHGISLVPNLLSEVFSDPRKMQGDGLHPNELGQPVMREHVQVRVESMIMD